MTYVGLLHRYAELVHLHLVLLHGMLHHQKLALVPFKPVYSASVDFRQQFQVVLCLLDDFIDVGYASLILSS
jgi:hypothetical protein